jgi:PIN domain nuclease of toxin-antitoxin system
VTTAAVLDSSAVLAWLQGEDGADVVEPLVEGGVISAVNWSEVLQKTLAAGLDAEAVGGQLKALGLRVEPVTEADALPAARWWLTENTLSLGDRCCLALAERLGAQAVTTDSLWSSTGADVLLIR